MNLVELDQALRKLRLSGMADVLETRLHHAQTEPLAPIDLVATLVTDELQRRHDRLLARRHKQARFRDPDRALETFDFTFNRKMNRALIYELATARFITQREDVLFAQAARDRELFEEGVRFPIEDGIALVDGRAADGLREVALAKMPRIGGRRVRHRGGGCGRRWG